MIKQLRDIINGAEKKYSLCDGHGLGWVQGLDDPSVMKKILIGNNISNQRKILFYR